MGGQLGGRGRAKQEARSKQLQTKTSRLGVSFMEIRRWNKWCVCASGDGIQREGLGGPWAEGGGRASRESRSAHSRLARAEDSYSAGHAGALAFPDVWPEQSGQRASSGCCQACPVVVTLLTHATVVSVSRISCQWLPRSIIALHPPCSRGLEWLYLRCSVRWGRPCKKGWTVGLRKPGRLEIRVPRCPVSQSFVSSEHARLGTGTLDIEVVQAIGALAPSASCSFLRP